MINNSSYKILYVYKEREKIHDKLFLFVCFVYDETVLEKHKEFNMLQFKGKNVKIKKQFLTHIKNSI